MLRHTRDGTKGSYISRMDDYESSLYRGIVPAGGDGKTSRNSQRPGHLNLADHARVHLTARAINDPRCTPGAIPPAVSSLRGRSLSVTAMVGAVSVMP